MHLKAGKDYVGVGVGAAIYNDEEKLFLAERGPKAKNEAGKWEFPGGSVEFGETLEAALTREIREEYGFTIEVIELLHVVDHLIPEEGQHWVSPTFICKYKTGTPQILEPEKCSQIGWFSIEEIEQKKLSLATLPDIKFLKERKK